MAKRDFSEGLIEIFGASQNNLKDIDVKIPINTLTVVTGVSGSGKSSLAFDTLYAEGQRRYVESMSAYARQFLERIRKPSVREIRGISPAVAIKQKNTTRNPRSTVGTVTEIYDFLRLLYARAGLVLCRNCGREVRRDSVDHIVEELVERASGSRAFITFPLAGSSLDLSRETGASPEQIMENLLKQGFHRLIPNREKPSEVISLPVVEPAVLGKLLSFSVLVDRLVIDRSDVDRLTDSLELSFAEGNGVLEVVLLGEGEEDELAIHRYSERFECQVCSIPYEPLEPQLFSFNNPYGACPTCHGFGSTVDLDRDLIIPDIRKTLRDGPVDPFTKPKYRTYQRRLLEYAERTSTPLDIPFEELPDQFQEAVWHGNKEFLGVKGFFDNLSRKKYKMHIRIFISRYRGYSRCYNCNGERLRESARDVHLGDKRIAQLSQMMIADARSFFDLLELRPDQASVAHRLIVEITKRLDFLIQVGLDYLTLDRITSTLSGGEMQRIHLAASLGSSLSGTLYVLDEPSIGLHVRDQQRLIEILKRLRDLGNTMVVVEHEKEIINSPDYIIDMGPGPGELGGYVVFDGDAKSLERSRASLTGKYLRGDISIPIPVFRRPLNKGSLTVRGAKQHNLKNLTLQIPLGGMVCITGVSGSGKSTLVHDILFAGIKKLRGEWNGPVGRFEEIEGWNLLSDVLLVDQTPIGKTPRSNPVTYIKAFDEIRRIFASLREAHARNLTPSHFSFNLPGGRCETCRGSGTVTVEMQFLADVELECEECKGTRYQKKTLEVTYKGKNIHDVLNLTVAEALKFFSSPPNTLIRKLKFLADVGLGYLRLGQSATTLSGGEAQRIKLAAYLSKKTAGQPLFIFDEPTTGLHFDDIGKLLRAFDKLLARGASVIVIEHNLDVIKCADWIIDLGPEGGECGGELVVAGSPEDVAQCASSYTGRYLKNYLKGPCN